MSNVDRRLRILMVITTLDMGGAEKHLHLLCRGLVGKGHAADLVFLKGSGSLAPDFEALGVNVEKIDLATPLRLPRAVAALCRKIRGGRYDVVHSHLLKADLVAALAGPRRLISSKHNDERALLNPVFSLVHGLISARASRVIVLSDHVGRFVERHGRVPRERIERIYYGLDMESFKTSSTGGEDLRRQMGIRPGVPVLTMVARFAPQKDHATLLRALRLLQDDGVDCHLLLVGDDPFGGGRKKAEILCRDLGLQDCVTFTGVRRDVPDLLSLTHCFVMPSLWEGLGLVFLEAMACSLPVVANRVSAIPEIVVHGETGLLVPPGRPEPLKGALAELLNDREKAAALGRAGKERLVRRFGLSKMIDETERVYHGVLEGPGDWKAR